MAVTQDPAVPRRPGVQRARRRAHSPMSDINVTPMVDVMLVLLVIFMVTAPLLTVGVNVDLPRTKASVIQGKDEPLAVTLLHHGVVVVPRRRRGVFVVRGYFRGDGVADDGAEFRQQAVDGMVGVILVRLTFHGQDGIEDSG